MDIETIKQMLGLQPLPTEGGFYAEFYRSNETLRKTCLPERYDGDRCLSTAIYFVLTKDTFSALHRLKSDEVYHFYLGDPVEALLLHKGRSGDIITIGNDLASGMRPQLVVPRGTWQGSRLKPGGTLALLGTTVAPGFEFADFELGNRASLLATYSRFSEMIQTLTR